MGDFIARSSSRSQNTQWATTKSTIVILRPLAVAFVGESDNVCRLASKLPRQQRLRLSGERHAAEWRLGSRGLTGLLCSWAPRIRGYAPALCIRRAGKREPIPPSEGEAVDETGR